MSLQTEISSVVKATHRILRVHCHELPHTHTPIYMHVGYIMFRVCGQSYSNSVDQQAEIVLYCIVSINLYSASCSAHQSEALPVRETQREESSLERTKRRTWHTS